MNVAKQEVFVRQKIAEAVDGASGSSAIVTPLSALGSSAPCAPWSALPFGSPSSAKATTMMARHASPPATTNAVPVPDTRTTKDARSGPTT